MALIRAREESEPLHQDSVLQSAQDKTSAARLVREGGGSYDSACAAKSLQETQNTHADAFIFGVCLMTISLAQVISLGNQLYSWHRAWPTFASYLCLSHLARHHTHTRSRYQLAINHIVLFHSSLRGETGGGGHGGGAQETDRTTWLNISLEIRDYSLACYAPHCN